MTEVKRQEKLKKRIAEHAKEARRLRKVFKNSSQDATLKMVNMQLKHIYQALNILAYK